MAASAPEVGLDHPTVVPADPAPPEPDAPDDERPVNAS